MDRAHGPSTRLVCTELKSGPATHAYPGDDFLANVNSRSRSLYAVARPSVVCPSSVVGNARAPYSGGCNFRQYFYGIWYVGYPLTSTKNFTEIVPGEPRRRGSYTQEG